MRRLIVARMRLTPAGAGAVGCRELIFDGASFTVGAVAAGDDLRLFRDRLGLPDVLYFDGLIARL